MKKRKFVVRTFGCQMNYSDSERVEAYLESMGFDKTGDELKADIIVFNTCSIRQKAEDKFLGLMPKVKLMKKENPELKVVLTGCMVRLSSTRNSEEKDKLLDKLQEVDIVLNISDLPKLASLLRECEENIVSEIEEESFDHYFKLPASYLQTPKNQAYIPISMGCDKFCTYCIVPYSRGREKSRPISDILAEAEKVSKMGVKEITLLGQTVNSYGLSSYDNMYGNIGKVPSEKEPFVFLLEEIDKFKKFGLERVKWTSPHPKDMSSQLIDCMATLDTQMPSLHLPVQSGDNAVLKRMNRPYTFERYRDIVSELREKIPGIAISTDIIVGFSGETDEEFERTREFFEEMEFEFAYLAKYSERKGTFAEKRLEDDVSPEIKKYRWNVLNDILKKNSKKSLESFLGKEVKVLFEKVSGDSLVGRSEHAKEVKVFGLNNKEDLLGKIVPVEIKESREWELIGDIKNNFI